MKQVEDTFTDTDATAIAAHTPDIDRPGGGWTGIAGVWTIQDNATAVTSVANARAIIDTDLSDGRFKVDVTVGDANDAAYLIFRSNAAVTNYWRAGLDDAAQVVRLYVVTAGVPILEGEREWNFDEDSTYEVKVECNASSIKVYVNDVLKIQHTSHTYEAQEYAGIYADLNADAVFDDFVAEDRPTCLYCTTADVKSRLGEQWTSGTIYDEELEEAIEESSRMLDISLYWEDCHFAASDLATVTRYYDGIAGLEMQIDRFLDDADFAVAVDEDADGVYTAWVRDTDYVTWPYNADYITRIIVKTDATVYFVTGQRLVEITGRIGAYSEPPAVIRKACVIMVAKAWKRAHQLYQDTGAIEALGQLKYVLAIDPEVEAILKVVPRRGPFG